MQAAVECVRSSLTGKRNDESYLALYEKATKLINSIEMHSTIWVEEELIRILFVVPVSSCEAEKSFSALPRLKTWLRASMGQERLNGVVVCNVHKDRLNSLKRENICQQFVGSIETRKHMSVLLFSSVYSSGSQPFWVLEPLHILRQGTQGFELSSGTSTLSILYVNFLETLWYWLHSLHFLFHRPLAINPWTLVWEPLV